MKKRILPVVILLTTISAACTRKVYIPVENLAYRTDTLRLNTLRHDSIVSIDSIIIRSQGDTIIKEAWRWRDRERLRCDTIYRSRTDTLYRTIVRSHDHKQSSSSLTERIRSGILKIVSWALLLIALAAYIRKRKSEV